MKTFCILWIGLAVTSGAPGAPAALETEAAGLRQLLTVHRVYVDRLTGGETAAQMRDILISSLAGAELFVLTEKEEKADAVIRGAAEDLVFTEVHTSSDGINAHANLGNSLFLLPVRLPDAIAQYEAALRIEPGYAKVHHSLGNALERIPGRLPEAIAEFEAALRSEPDFAEAHVNLGKALAQTPGRLPEAIAEYEAALRIRPDPQVRQEVERLRAGLQPATPFH